MMGPTNARRDADAGEAFWRFSLALYARPGVAEALIALQDRAGRDVNLMLFALWFGAVRGRRLDAARLAAAAAGLPVVL
ncbi:MAG TPA: TIGR02444 family protein, partial [Stellaceae bacterium]|nr:TIGR02444 family protein [Stellaceae bacterium]